MKTDAELLNEIARKTDILRQLTEEEAKQLKAILLGMHNEIIQICDRYSLTVMLGGGSCLGAVRHKGFIPWDDDLDLIMPRKDYETLISLYKEGRFDQRLHFEFPNKEKDVKNAFLKVFLKNTVYKDIFDDAGSFPSNIFVDIFPMDYAPRNKFARRMKSIISDGLQFICTCVLYKKYPSRNLELFYKQDDKAYKRYKFRLLVGGVFSFISHRRWVCMLDMFNRSRKPTDYYTIPCGRKHYLGETLHEEVFFPPLEGSFENKKTYLPHSTHDYLSNLYGNYMQIPSEDKRERHFIIDVKFNQE